MANGTTRSIHTTNLVVKFIYLRFLNVKPETERLVKEEIQNGPFRSVDEMIVEGVQSWRKKHRAHQIGSEQRLRAVDDALAFARDRAIPLSGVSIKDLIHEGHRL